MACKPKHVSASTPVEAVVHKKEVPAVGGDASRLRRRLQELQRRGELVLGQSWSFFVREWRKKFSLYATWVGVNPSTDCVSWYEFLDAWGDLLLISGRAELGGFPYVVWAGEVQEAF